MRTTNLSAEILAEFWAAGRKIKHRLGPGNPMARLTIAQLETLRQVLEKREVLMKDIATCQAITPPSATAMVDHLTKLKLLSRHPDPRDRRIVRLQLTKKGTAAFRRAIRQQHRRLRTLLRNLNLQEQKQLLRLLKKLSVA